MIRDLSALPLALYRSLTTASSSSRVAMLTRLIQPSARLPTRERLRRGNCHDSGAFLARQCGSHPVCRRPTTIPNRHQRPRRTCGQDRNHQACFKPGQSPVLCGTQDHTFGPNTIACECQKAMRSLRAKAMIIFLHKPRFDCSRCELETTSPVCRAPGNPGNVTRVGSCLRALEHCPIEQATSRDVSFRSRRASH